MAAAVLPTEPQAARQTERYVRICPTHGCTVREETRSTAFGKLHLGSNDVLVCAGGSRPHDVEKWAVFDRLAGKIIGYGKPETVTILGEGMHDVFEYGRRLSDSVPLNRRKGITPKSHRERLERARGGLEPVTLNLPDERFYR